VQKEKYNEIEMKNSYQPTSLSRETGRIEYCQQSQNPPNISPRVTGPPPINVLIQSLRNSGIHSTIPARHVSNDPLINGVLSNRKEQLTIRETCKYIDVSIQWQCGDPIPRSSEFCCQNPKSNKRKK